MLSFDPRKNEKNIKKHGLALADAHLFDFEGSIDEVQFEEGEERIKALGEWDRQFVAVVVYVQREGQHIISARRAERKEILTYVRAKSGA